MATSLRNGDAANIDLPRPMDRSGLLMGAFLIVGVVTAAAALVAVEAPDLRPLLLQEDGIVEMATAVFFALAAFGAAASLTMWGMLLPLLLAGLVGFAGLMDETSFGSRLLGFQPPPLYGGGQLDGLHDLLIVVFRLTRDLNPLLSRLLVGLLLASSIALAAFVATQLLKGFRGDLKHFSGHTLFFAHVACIGLAQVIDISVASSHALSAMEEVFELDAAILLAFYVLQQAREASTIDRARL
ncbi:hypothetical protein MAUB1S_05804 [Mycolicibacterium aubagnense]